LKKEVTNRTSAKGVIVIAKFEPTYFKECQFTTIYEHRFPWLGYMFATFTEFI
jgi:hypothetical protein